MFKKTLAFIICMAAVAGCFSSCGNDAKNTADNNSGESGTASSASEASIVQIANFTEPEIGDTIITMKVKDYGEIKFRVFPEYAEKGVENFVELAKQGYYDGLTFHRVISDFMIQGGDPLGTGLGGESVWGGEFDGGTDPHLIHAVGAVAYANSGSTATDGSQFFIVSGSIMSTDDINYYKQQGIAISPHQEEIYSSIGGAPWLDGGYTVFGQVIDGLDIVNKIQHVETSSADKPVEDVIIESVTVGEYNGEKINWFLRDYVNKPEVQENVEPANFTEPKNEEIVVSMKIENYDTPVKIKLFPEYASKGVENFVELIKQGYYDGLTFHRVIKDFMIQGGDPLGTGAGGESVWGGKFEGGTDPHLLHAAGAVSYANTGATSTNGSQFFIVTGEVYSDDEIAELEKNGYVLSDYQKEIYTDVGGTPWLDGDYTVFGQVFEGLDVVFDIQNVATGETNKPIKDVIIESMTVEQYSGEPVRFKITDYNNTPETEENSESSEETEETEASSEESAE